jgi:hypothetical protein
MSAPFVFIGTHKVREGKFDEYQEFFAKFVADVVEPKEPRLHVFQSYWDRAASELSIVQVHPDAESMLYHMSLIGPDSEIEYHVGQSYAEYLERESRLQVFGEQRGGVVDVMHQLAGDAATSLTTKEPGPGFSRLSAP